ncbi:hypothetical protein [Borrelia parkeri]|nr:hypothetical protein [Borrelia parkeri]
MGKKILSILSKTFMLLSCTLLFGESKKNITHYIMNHSKVYIPKEDLSEDFDNEEEIIYHKKNEISKDNNSNTPSKKSKKFKVSEQFQVSDNRKTRNDVLTNEELEYPKSLNTKNFYSEQENIDDWFIKDIDKLKLRIENYEKKIENIENLLSHTNIKSIKKRMKNTKF